jgi:hypothetical protein
MRYADAIAPEGWFFLYEGIGNRVGEARAREARRKRAEKLG